jgi:hypothetical protein
MLHKEHVLGGKVHVVLGEVYYEKLEGHHLVEALNAFYTIKRLRELDVVSES